MQLNEIHQLDPARTAEAVAPLLLELSPEAVQAISTDLDALMQSPTPGLRSAALALKVRSGASLDTLAEQDPAALLEAVRSLPADQAPQSLSADMLALAQSGNINTSMAIEQAVRLSKDLRTLFKQLAGWVDGAQDLGYEKWGSDHKLAMAALAAMHSLPEENWPAGFNDYKIARADPETLKLGSEIFHEPEKGCIKCHGDQGQGTEGFPPLAGSPTLLGDPHRSASIVKYGLAGTLPHTRNPVDGNPFNAQMEPLSYFNNAEVAAVLTYVRQSFGNYASPVSVEMVAAARRPKAEGQMWDLASLTSWYPYDRDRILGSLPGPQLQVVHWSAPSLGVLYMLAVVTLLMLAILVVTMLGGGPVDHDAHASLAAA